MASERQNNRPGPGRKDFTWACASHACGRCVRCGLDRSALRKRKGWTRDARNEAVDRAMDAGLQAESRGHPNPRAVAHRALNYDLTDVGRKLARDDRNYAAYAAMVRQSADCHSSVEDALVSALDGRDNEQASTRRGRPPAPTYAGVELRDKVREACIRLLMRVTGVEWNRALEARARAQMAADEELVTDMAAMDTYLDALDSLAERRGRTKDPRVQRFAVEAAEKARAVREEMHVVLPSDRLELRRRDGRALLAHTLDAPNFLGSGRVPSLEELVAVSILLEHWPALKEPAAVGEVLRAEGNAIRKEVERHPSLWRWAAEVGRELEQDRDPLGIRELEAMLRPDPLGMRELEAMLRPTNEERELLAPKSRKKLDFPDGE